MSSVEEGANFVSLTSGGHSQRHEMYKQGFCGLIQKKQRDLWNFVLPAYRVVYQMLREKDVEKPGGNEAIDVMDQ